MDFLLCNLFCFSRKVVFGEDEIAYQIGETTQILSRGFLCATPHCVRVCSIFIFLCVLKAEKISSEYAMYNNTNHQIDSFICFLGLSSEVYHDLKF